MKYKTLGTTLILASILCTKSVLAFEASATDGENFGHCKRAAKAAFGETSKVTIRRLQRYKGEFTGHLRLYNEDVNDGKSFRFTCVIDKAGDLRLNPSGYLSIGDSGE